MKTRTFEMKRFLALFLAAAIVFLSGDLTWLIGANAIGEVSGDGNTLTVTDGQLVSANYGDEFTELEKEILNSSAIIGNVHTVKIPKDNSLVKVDAEENTVEAESYVDGNYEWIPVSADIVYSVGGTEVRNTIAMENGKCTFTCPVPTYYVEVTYALDIEVAAALQKSLANAPYKMAHIVSMMGFLQMDAELLVIPEITDAVDLLYSLTTGELPVVIDDEAITDAIVALEALYEGDGKPDLYVTLCEEYADADNKLQFCFDNADVIFDELDEVYGVISELNNYREDIYEVELALDAMGFTEEALAIGSFLPELDVMAEYLEGHEADEGWDYLAETFVKDSCTDKEYADLCELVEEAIRADGEINATLVKKHNGFTAKNPLRAAETKLTATVNQQIVYIKVQAEAIDGTNTVNLDEFTSTVILNKGVADADIIAAITANGVEADALAAWDAYYNVGTENYERTVTGVTATLENDIEVVIKYTPNEYTLTFDYEEGTSGDTFPYGYVFRLPRHEDMAKSYDYKINGTAYRENTDYRVVGDATVTRTVGAAVEEKKLSAVVALSGFGLSDSAKEILYSGAFNDESLWFRTPSASAGLVEVSASGIDTYVVTAASYASGLLSGAKWMPVSATAVDKNGAAVVGGISFSGDTASFTTDSDFDKVVVEYALNIPDVDLNKVDEFISLPDVLKADIAAQKSDLDALYDSLYSRLSAFTGQELRVIASDAFAKDFKSETKAALLTLLDSCIDEEDAHENLYLTTYLGQYKALGMSYCYNGNKLADIQDQIDLVCEEFSIILQDQKFRDKVEAEKAGYIEKIENLVNDLSQIDIKPINSNVDFSSAYVGKLVTAIENYAASGIALMSLTTELVINAEVSAPAPNKKAVNITVQQKDSNGNIVGTPVTDGFVWATGTTIDAAHVADLETLLATLKAGFALDSRFYDLEASAALPGVGHVLNNDVNVVFTYVPAEFKVEINGNIQTMYADKILEITLPGCFETGISYRYTVGSDVIDVINADRTYTFESLEAVHTLFGADRHYEVGFERVDKVREEILKLVDSLNKVVVDSGAFFAMDDKNCLPVSFIPMEDASGNLAIVLRVTPKTETYKIQNVMDSLADVLLEMYFDDILLGGRQFYYDSQVHLQSIVDLVVYSGLDLDYLRDLISADGQIKEMTLEGFSAIGATGNDIVYGNKYVNDVDTLGGKLIGSTMSFSRDNSDYKNVAFYVTVEDFDQNANVVKKGDKALEKLSNYLDFALNGAVDVKVNAPDSAYAYFLAQLLVTDLAEVADPQDYSLKEMIDKYADIIRPLLTSNEFSVETLQRTLERAGIDRDVTQYKRIIELAYRLIRIALNDSTYTTVENGNKCEGVLSVNVSSALSRVGLSDTVKGFIYEAEDGRSVDVAYGLELENQDVVYEALIVDAKANGIKNKYTVVRDLSKVIENLSSDAVVILLSDVAFSEEVTLNNRIYIDLNGYDLAAHEGMVSTLAGDDIRRTVTILDSTTTVNGAGTVTGKFSGNEGSFCLIGGKYTEDITGMIGDGFKVNAEGYVESKYYTVQVSGDDINIILNGDIIDETVVPPVGPIVKDIAAKLAVKYYTAAALKVDGEDAYAINLPDLIPYLDGIRGNLVEGVNDVIDCVDLAGVTNIVNKILADITDFAAIKANIEAGNNILSYDVETYVWDINAAIVGGADDNYFEAGVVPGALDESNTINVLLNATDDQKQTITDLLGAIDDVLTIDDLSVELNDVEYKGGREFAADFGGNFKATIDLTGDTDYAVIVAAIMAYNADDYDKAAFVNGINSYIETGRTADIKSAFDIVTSDELIDAIKATTYRAFADILYEIDVDAAKLEDAVALEAKYSLIRRVMSKTMGLLTIEGIDLSHYEIETSFGTYNFVKKYLDHIDADITLKLFLEEPELLISVYDETDTLVLDTQLLSEAFAAVGEGYTIKVHNNVILDADVSVANNIKLVGADKIDFASYTVTLTDANASITSDAAITVESGIPTYIVVVEEDNGTYTYKLDYYPVIIVDANGDMVAGYKAEELAEALEAAADGETVIVRSAVTLMRNALVENMITVEGVNNVTFGGYNIILAAADAQITTDAAITVMTNLAGYLVVEEGAYTYKLTNCPIVIVDGEGKILAGYLADELAEALEAAGDGETVRVRSRVTLDRNANVTADITIAGVSYISFGANKLVLAAEDAQITTTRAIDNYVVSGIAEYSVVVEGAYTYKLNVAPIVIVDAAGDIIARYTADQLAEALEAAGNGETVKVRSAVVLGRDVAITAQIAVTGMANVNLDGHTVALNSTDAQLTTDADISAAVVSGVDYYNVTVDGAYTYKLENAPIAIIDANGEVKEYLAADKLEEALEKAENGDTVKVTADVVLGGNAEIDTAIKLEGADKINFNGNKLLLTDAAASVQSDVAINVVESALDEYIVTVDGANTYKLELVPIAIIGTDGKVKENFTADELALALESAAAGETVVVRSDVTLDTDATVSASINVTGAAHITFNADIVIDDETAVIVSDGALSVKSGVVYYIVKDDNNKYSLELVEVAVENAAGDINYYDADELATLLENAADGDIISVFKPAELTSDVNVDTAITLNGVSNITMGTNAIILTDAAASVEADGALTVESGVKYYGVKEENNKYTLEKAAIAVEDANGNVKAFYTADKLAEVLENAVDGDVISVFAPAELTADANVDANITVNGAANITFGSNAIVLADPNASVEADGALTVESGVKYYEVKEENGKYTLEQVDIAVEDANGNVTYYTADKLADVLENAANGDVITVFAPATLDSDVNVDTAITLNGTSNITLGTNAIILTDENASVEADGALTVESGVKYFEVKAENNKYTLEQAEITVEDANGNVKGYYTADELVQVLENAADGDIVTLTKPVTVTEDIEINSDVTINGASNINLNGNKIVITDPDASVTADSALDVVTDLKYYEVKEENNKYTVEHVDVAVEDANGTVKDYYTADELADAIENAADGDIVTVFVPATVTDDIEVDSAVIINGASNIDLGTNAIVLTDPNASVEADGALTVESGVKYYEVKEENGKYTLEQVDIAVEDANGNVKGYYTADKLADVLENAEDGDVITVFAPATLGSDVNVDTAITLNGVSNIDLGGNAIILTDKNASVEADGALTVESGVKYYEVKEENNKYTLEAIAIVVEDADGNFKAQYTADKLTEVLENAEDGDVVIIGAPSTLAADTTVDTNITINGAANIVFDGKKIVVDKNGKITADTAIDTSNFASAIDCHAVVETVVGGKYVYALESGHHTETILPAVDPTCTTTGWTEGKKCTVCGEITVPQTVIDVVDHKSEIILPAVGATCTTTGWTEGKKCSVCDAITDAQEVIPMIPHTEEILPAVGATCTDTGLAEGKICSVCGTITVPQDVIAKIPHTEEIIPAVGATCTDTGLTEGKKCSVCGEILVEQTVADKIPHTEEIIPAVGATCTETGLTEGKKCSVCGEILVEQTVVDKIPHTEEILPAVGATCTHTGLTEGKKCSVCGEILVEQTVVDMIPHTEEIIPAVGATCTETGLTEGKKCSVCGEILVAQTVVDKLGHTEEVIPGKSATCTETGLTEGKKCTVCGEITDAQEIIPVKDHTEEILPAVDATCTTTGWTEGKKCSDCGAILDAQEVIPVRAHTEEVIPGKDATYTETGLTEGKKCADCGAILVAQQVIPVIPCPEPEISAPVVNVQPDGLIRGAKVESGVDGGLIYIDVAPEGITLAQFNNLVNITVDKYEIKSTKHTNVDGTVERNSGDLVCTGDTVVVTATNEVGKTVTVKYVVIVLGDTNMNGIIESGDAVRMTYHFMDEKLMSGYALLAADTNCNGTVDSGDAVKNTAKYVHKWEDGTYVSDLK